MEEKAMVREQSPGVMRRFLARQFDVSLCAAIVTAVLTLGFRVNVLQLGWVLSWVVSAAGLLILLLTEPLFLHLWGTTPGKWVLGMRIYDPSRSHIDYGDALARTASVITRGLGWGVPIVGFWCMARCCYHGGHGEKMTWETGEMGELRQVKCGGRLGWRAAAGIALLAFSLALSVDGLLYAQFPPNRGELTVEEFAENYNWFRTYADAVGDVLPRMASDVSLITVVEDLNYTRTYADSGMELTYDVTDGVLTGVHFALDETAARSTALYATAYMLALTDAFACAGLGSWRHPLRRTEQLRWITAIEPGSGSRAFGDAEISYELVCNGYSWSYAAPITFIFEQEDAKKHEFSLRFDITLRSE